MCLARQIVFQFAFREISSEDISVFRMLFLICVWTIITEVNDDNYVFISNYGAHYETEPVEWTSIVELL